MKYNNVISSLALIFMLNLASAAEVKTSITCQQDEGDRWLEVGIAINDGPGFIAYTVDRNNDTQKSKLISFDYVSKRTSGKKVIYSDYLETFKLIIKNDANGTLSILKDGPGSVLNLKMNCYKDSKIRFDE